MTGLQHVDGVAIPTALLQDPLLSPRAARVLLYLLACGGASTPGTRTIAADTGMSRSTVKAALQDLDALDYLPGAPGDLAK